MSDKTRPPSWASAGWTCGGCGELITRIEDGWVEWLAGEGERTGPQVKGLRLVHRRSASPEGAGEWGCQYDAKQVFRNDRSVVEGLSLKRFVGPDGLMLLLSLFALGELPQSEVLELAKRVQIPGYEQARELFRRALQRRVVAPVIGEGFYLQSEIDAVLRWARNNSADLNARSR